MLPHVLYVRNITYWDAKFYLNRLVKRLDLVSTRLLLAALRDCECTSLISVKHIKYSLVLIILALIHNLLL